MRAITRNIAEILSRENITQAEEEMRKARKGAPEKPGSLQMTDFELGLDEAIITLAESTKQEIETIIQNLQTESKKELQKDSVYDPKTAFSKGLLVGLLHPLVLMNHQFKRLKESKKDPYTTEYIEDLLNHIDEIQNGENDKIPSHMLPSLRIGAMENNVSIETYYVATLHSGIMDVMEQLN